MKRILVFSGTSDGRHIIEGLLLSGCHVTASVATKEGALCMEHSPCLRVLVGRLGEEEIATLLVKEGYDCVLDASHPYAQALSRNIMRAAAETKTEYIRYERPKEYYPGNIHYVEDYKEAVDEMDNRSGNVLITTGTNYAEEFKRVSGWQQRVFVRVLEREESLQKCLALGWDRTHIISKNGPFSTEENCRDIAYAKAKMLLTKDSGRAGGVQEKANACLRCDIPLLIIKRPHLEYPLLFDDEEDLINYIKEKQ